MNILSWNCRGLGSPRTVHELSRLVRKYKPQILFISETKRNKLEMEGIKIKLQFDCCFVVDCVGRGGGLALLWMIDTMIDILSYTLMQR